MSAGVFAEWQPAYAEAGLVTLPLDDKKHGPPGWNKMGLPRSARLAAELNHCNVFGLLTGRGRSRGVQHPGVCVIDYDGTSESVLADLINRHGEPGAIVRTASLKFHLYYRNSGERRKIRIHGKGSDDPLVDLCGFGGYVVAPPSRLGSGGYEFIEGNFDAVAHGDLPKMGGLRAEHYLNSGFVAPAGTILPDAAARNESLYQMALQFLAATPDLQAMTMYLKLQNEGLPLPMAQTELDGITSNAWRRHMSGSNGYAAPYVQTPHAIFDRIMEHRDGRLFLQIYMHLRRHSGARHLFVVANAMSKAMGCKEEKIGAARKFFEAIGAIVLVSGYTTKRPAAYRWPGVPHDIAIDELQKLDLTA